MKMRVSIARAIVTNPRLILMDEPFAALDEITRHKLNNDLLEMKAKIGCTVIFVTHSVFESPCSCRTASSSWPPAPAAS
jgi:NitT/TauT family transport system ATP-binding protein